MTEHKPGPNGDADTTVSGQQYTAVHSADTPQTPEPEASSPTPVPTVTAAVATSTGAPVGPGTVIFENYEIKQLLAKGGMGEVYLAEHTELKTRHAVKVIKPQLLGNDMVRPLTRREAMLLSQINNDAVVAYHGFLKDTQGNYYLIMEYVEGPSLKQAMAEEAYSLSEEGYYTLRRRLAQGLMVLHQNGVVHRDLSPDNVILQGAELAHAKLIDLGIAKVIQADAENTIIGASFAGKLRYASPEQLGMYGGEVGPPSDMYSLGLVLVAALLGKPLDMGKNPITACALRMEVPDLSQVPKGLRPQLTALLQPEPGNRPADLQSFLKSWPDPYAPSEGSSRSWKALAAALAVIVLGGSVGYFYLAPDPNKLPPGELAAYFDRAVADGNIRDADGHFEILSSQYPDYPQLSAMAERLNSLRASAASEQVSRVETALKDRVLDLAGEELDKLHAIDPGNRSLPGLRAELQQRRAEVSLEAQLNTLLASAGPDTEALLAGRQALAELGKLDDANPRIATLREQLEARIASQVAQRLEAANTALQANDQATAQTALQALGQLLPSDDPRLAELQQQQLRLGQQLTLLDRLDAALSRDDLQEARQWWGSLASQEVSHPRLAALQTRFQEAVDRRIDTLEQDVDRQLSSYQLEQAGATITEITRLDVENRHQASRDALVARLDRAQGVVAQADDVRVAIAAGDVLNARRRLQRLQSMAPDYPQIADLQTDLTPLIDNAVTALVAQAREAQAQQSLDALRGFQAQLAQLAPEHPQLAIVTAWIQTLESAPEADRQARLLAQFQEALAADSLQEARRLLTVLRAEPGTGEQIADLQQNLATAYLDSLEVLLSSADYRAFARQLDIFRVFSSEAQNADVLESLSAPRLASLGENLLTSLDQALQTGELPQANQLLPILDSFFSNDDPRLLDSRQRLELASALAGCRTEGYRQAPDSRVGLRTAVQCFQELLRRYPGNHEAAQAMAALTDRHAGLIRALWQQGEQRQAEEVLDDLLGFASRYPGLDGLLAGLPGISFSEPLADGSAGPRMVVIPAGEVLLSLAGQPHKIPIERPFAVSRFEISRAEFSHFVDAQGGYRTDAENYASQGYGCFYFDARGELITDDVQSSWRNPRFRQEGSHPVVCVTVRDAWKFGDWLSSQTDRSYRLITDAEWEYLARSGNTDPGFWQQILGNGVCKTGNLRQGDEADSCRDGMDYTTATGRFTANDFGVYDLIGNVAEWTCSADSTDPAALNHCLDTDTMQQSLRDNRPAQVLTRGGSWYDSPDKLIAGDHRVPVQIHYPLNQVGFRVVRELAGNAAIATAASSP